MFSRNRTNAFIVSCSDKVKRLKSAIQEADDIDAINRVRIREMRFAWDSANHVRNIAGQDTSRRRGDMLLRLFVNFLIGKDVLGL